MAVTPFADSAPPAIAPPAIAPPQRAVGETVGVTPISIRDVAFTVARQIEQCPKTMMLRELVMNAVEAAARAPEGTGRVELRALRLPAFGETRKLAVFNTGPGLDAMALGHVCDLAASLGKKMALDGNFGMGAKVAALPSNALGLRYRSCANGIVSEVTLGRLDGVYGKLRVAAEGAWREVVDVTGIVRAEAVLPLDEDWTEVVLYGNRADQDTVADPFDGDPRQDRHWISTGLLHRFYRLPVGVELRLGPGVAAGRGRRLLPIAELAGDFGRAETVDVGDGVRVHYLWDPPSGDEPGGHSGAVAAVPALSCAAIVFRGEMFDVRKARKWAADAPGFGIPFEAERVSVHVELTDDFPVRSEPYRRFLQFAHGDQRPLVLEDFAQLVVAQRPGWLVDLVGWPQTPGAASTGALRRELQGFLDQLKDDLRAARPPAAGHSLPASLADLVADPRAARRVAAGVNLGRAPEIVPLHRAQDAEQKGLRGKAARYVRETNQLFVNLGYPAFAEARDAIARRHAGTPAGGSDPDRAVAIAGEWAERLVMAGIGWAVVHAQARQMTSGWSPEEARKALEPECLSLAADAWRDAVAAADARIAASFAHEAQETP